MLELWPTCANCNTALPPDSLEARVYTYECTLCMACVETVLENVGPNCGSGFVSPSRRANLVRPVLVAGDTAVQGVGVDGCSDAPRFHALQLCRDRAEKTLVSRWSAWAKAKRPSGIKPASETQKN